jgi:hypothetical protein
MHFARQRKSAGRLALTIGLLGGCSGDAGTSLVRVRDAYGGGYGLYDGGASVGGARATGGAASNADVPGGEDGGSGGESTVARGGSPAGPSCARTTDCPVNTVCAPVNEVASFYCVPPSTSGGILGTVCATASSTTAPWVTDRCYDWLCPSNLSLRCSRLCVEDVDCRGPSGEFICNPVNTAYSLCMATCQSATDCGTVETCIVARTPSGAHWVCGVAGGTIVAGQPCGAAAGVSGVCKSGLCLNVTPTALCTTACQADTDCPASLPRCGDVTLSGQTLRACSP